MAKWRKQPNEKGVTVISVYPLFDWKKNKYIGWYSAGMGKLWLKKICRKGEPKLPGR